MDWYILSLLPLVALFLSEHVAAAAGPFRSKHIPRAGASKHQSPVKTGFNPALSITTTPYDRFIQNIYDNSDTDHDGTISIQEAYELVLRLYIHVNRQAPVRPPSRSAIRRLFSISDTNSNHRISRDEFTQLARLLGRRALVRIVACKLINLMAAPLLATAVVTTWWPAAVGQQGQDWITKQLTSSSFVPKPLKEMLTSTNFWTTVFIVLFVQSLGKQVMGLVNVLLDLSLPRTEE